MERKARKQRNYREREIKLKLTLGIERVGGLWKAKYDIDRLLKDKYTKDRIGYLYTQRQYHTVVPSSQVQSS